MADRSTTAARERALVAHYPPPAIPLAPSRHPVLWRCYGPVNGVRVDVPHGRWRQTAAARAYRLGAWERVSRATAARILWEMHPWFRRLRSRSQ